MSRGLQRAPRHFCNFNAILARVQPFDFPDIRFDDRPLELFHCAHHQRWPQLPVVMRRVALQTLQLLDRRGDEEFEHEIAALAVQTVPEFTQAPGLAAIQLFVVLGVAAHQRFDKGRIVAF